MNYINIFKIKQLNYEKEHYDIQNKLFTSINKNYIIF